MLLLRPSAKKMFFFLAESFFLDVWAAKKSEVVMFRQLSSRLTACTNRLRSSRSSLPRARAFVLTSEVFIRPSPAIQPPLLRHSTAPSTSKIYRTQVNSTEEKKSKCTDFFAGAAAQDLHAANDHIVGTLTRIDYFREVQ